MKKLLDSLRAWRRRVRSRRDLGRLPSFLLDDIGVDEETRRKECQRWF